MSLLVASIYMEIVFFFYIYRSILFFLISRLRDLSTHAMPVSHTCEIELDLNTRPPSLTLPQPAGDPQR